MRAFTILFCVIYSANTFDIDFDGGFPDINDLFITENPKEDKIDLIPGVFIKNITLNIEKLNLTKFRKKLEAYESKLVGNTTKSKDFEALGINLNDTRRQVLFWDWNRADYRFASIQMTKMKALDLMLQMAYMSRHKLRNLEACKYFSRTDTGYRIAFVYRQLRRIFKKMMDIYTTMYNHKNKGWFHHDWHVQLHTKATKLHVDFLYLWWVLIRVDEKYCKLHGITSPIPKWMSWPPVTHS